MQKSSLLFKLAVGLAVLFGGAGLCAAEVPKYTLATDNHIYAQQLVTEIMVANPGLVAAGLHCVPRGGDRQAIIASTLDVIGKPSDPEDILHGATTIVPSTKAPKLGVMLPLLDRTGKEIGSLALQFKFQAGEDQVKYLAEATAIRDHVARQIPALAELFKPTP
ncbi:hypothetical protein [Opitutus sp. GAS368]|jgi:hypothetical protein|uniref:hypothetical protein n=1 Tax=Opitutus sp. GAS368 TaxID=1882749 RepID=UPI00087C8A69|nr:hypothetical protein [Opitutus sp. GAS368]SDR89853.1 hypothetical protein SAMN05444173_1258 [Opitutus sp. GAS368]